jgi:hypothetical protein
MHEGMQAHQITQQTEAHLLGLNYLNDCSSFSQGCMTSMATNSRKHKQTFVSRPCMRTVMEAGLCSNSSSSSSSGDALMPYAHNQQHLPPHAGYNP